MMLYNQYETIHNKKTEMAVIFVVCRPFLFISRCIYNKYCGHKFLALNANVRKNIVNCVSISYVPKCLLSHTFKTIFLFLFVLLQLTRSCVPLIYKLVEASISGEPGFPDLKLS